jgi:hypothetical protein
LITVAVLGGCDAGTCTSGGLHDALAGASAGDVVEVGGCRVEGAFVVPAGVTLRGSANETVLASGDPFDLVVELGDGARLEALHVEADGRAGVVTRGDATVTDVSIDAIHGLGVYVGGGAVALERVSIVGPVTAASAGEERWIEVSAIPSHPAVGCPRAVCECDEGAIDEADARVCVGGVWKTWAATIGLYASGATLTLEDVSIAGVAQYGVIADESALEWTAGSVRDVIGVGVLLRGGDAAITDVSIERVVAGLRGVPSYGLISTDDNDLTSERLAIADGERYGLLQLEATGAHSELSVRDHGDVGVWVGSSARFELGESSVIANNGFAGVVVSESHDVTLDGAIVEGTATVRRSVGTFGVQEIGDGVQLTGSYDAVRLANLTIRGNERVGLLVDAAPGVTFEAVAVDAGGAAFGALAGTLDVARGVITVATPAGWDTGITRTGAALANDPTASGELDLIVTTPDLAGARGIIAPMY